MRLEPLYRLTFSYRESYGTESERLLLAEGRAQGRVEGRFRGANRARRSAEGTWLPALEAAAETDDGATILLALTGRGRPEADPVGRVVAAVTHTTADSRYAWLNDALGVVAGEVYRRDRVVLDVAELVWEPLAQPAGYDLREE